MEKRPHGQIRTHERKDGLTTYSLRIRANGRREVVTLGTDADGWTMRKAERMLDQVLAEIQVGIWRPPSADSAVENETFHQFASRWWMVRKLEMRPTTRADYEWRLKKHLLPFFADFDVSAITIALVDEYRSTKVVERERIKAAAAAGRPLRDRRGQRRVALSNESINKTLVLLANILDTAVEHELLASNPARGKRRRLKADRPIRRFLEADELSELLAVAGALDRAARADRRIGRRPMIAVMAKSGLRVGEVCALRWRSVDTPHQRLVIEEAKTAAGVREVDLSLDLVEELNVWRAERMPASVDDFVFATDRGRPRDKDSVRERVLGPVVIQANEIRQARGIAPLAKITPHTLRRTYISLMLEAGAPLPYVMDQVGHADSKTPLEIYAQVQKRVSRTNVHAAFDRLINGANSGITSAGV
ncbi:MAG: tyrosine-type recombinase/integrase [Solirubrobacteraceae bacterium]